MKSKSIIELLELRIAPASASVMFTDIDGDKVKITASVAGADVPPLDAADLAFVGGGTDGQLATLNLTAAGFQGASISTNVTKVASGDGLVNIGFINAAGRDLGSVKVKGDLGVIDAGNGVAGTPAIKSLSARSMGIYGLATQDGVGDLDCSINGALGSLKVTGDVKDVSIRVFGGASATLGSVTIGGSLIGGAGGSSGEIRSDGDMGAVKIGRDVQAGAGLGSGAISCTVGRIASVTIGGSLIGGADNFSATIYSGGDIGLVKIDHDVTAGTGSSSGFIHANGDLAGVTIGGSLIGGASFSSGAILSGGDMGAVKIGRDLVGGDNTNGIIKSDTGKITSVSIGGSVFGGAISAATTLGAVKIGGSVHSGSGTHTGEIFSGGDMGPVKVGGDLDASGGLTDSTGRIISLSSLTSVTIGGSVLGGTGVSKTGEISSTGGMGPVKIGGSLIGGSTLSTGGGSDRSGYIQGDRIASVFIGGSIISGIDESGTEDLTRNASIRANDDIGAIVVKGSLVGHRNDGSNLGDTLILITARGQETLEPGATRDVAIKSITVGGRVENASIRAGYATVQAPVNGNASIGPVKVGGDWRASDLVAGVQDDADSPIDDRFGDADDELINNGSGDALIARIAKITIKGVVVGSGSAGVGDGFGFVAQQIGAFKSLGFTAALTAGTGLPIELSPGTGDVTIREV